MKIAANCLICLLLIAHAGFGQKADPEVIYQVSTLDALVRGDYDGKTACGSLKRRGDFV